MSPKERPREAGARQRKASARKPGKRQGPAKESRDRPTRKPGQLAPDKTVSDRSVVDGFSPRLREEFGRLQKDESRILKALEDPEIKRRFLMDPAGALERMGVEVPPLMKKRLKPHPGLPDLVTPRQFRLPNGQVVTARVNIHFTTGKRG